MGTGEALSATPPPAGQSEAVGCAAARTQTRIRGQVSLPALWAGRGAAQSRREALRSGGMSVSKKSWAALSR